MKAFTKPKIYEYEKLAKKKFPEYLRLPKLEYSRGRLLSAFGDVRGNRTDSGAVGMILIPPFISYQSVQDMKEVISTNDATIQGILLGVIIVLGFVCGYLYHRTIKQNTDLAKVHDKYQEEMKEMNSNHKADIKEMNEALYAKMEEFSASLVAMNKSYEQESIMTRQILKNQIIGR